MSFIREKIIEIAIEEATPLPYGKVSDLVLDGEGRRAGWRNLKAYFDEAVLGWSELHWRAKGKVKVGKDLKEIIYLQGVQMPNYRVPQQNKEDGVSWCGIFATWVLRKAGLNVWWTPVGGIVGDNVKYITGNEGFARGDVVVFPEHVHHAIVVNENHKIYEGDGSLDTINGNSGPQAIKRHSDYIPKQVAYYYKILD